MDSRGPTRRHFADDPRLPERALLVHGTETHETGWAVRHLVRYPLGPDFERTTREFLQARGPGVDVRPAPAPGMKLSA